MERAVGRRGTQSLCRGKKVRVGKSMRVEMEEGVEWGGAGEGRDGKGIKGRG